MFEFVQLKSEKVLLYKFDELKFKSRAKLKLFSNHIEVTIIVAILNKLKCLPGSL